MALKSLPEGLRNFLDYLNEVQARYALIQEEIQRMDHLTEDYLHKLEQPLSSTGRARVTTSMRKCRLVRRQLKNEAAIIEPLMDFVASGRGSASLSQLVFLLEKVLEVEESLPQSDYQPQVMSLEEYNKM